MPIYMNLPGPLKGTGPVTAEGFKGWISLDSCSQNVERPVIEGTAAAKNREWGAPKVAPFECSMKVDNSTPYMAKWSMGQPVQGDGIVEIAFVRTGDSGYLRYATIKLSAVILSNFSFNTSNSMEEKGTVEFKLSFLGIHFEFQQYNEDGTATSDGKVIGQYDQRTAKAAYA